MDWYKHKNTISSWLIFIGLLTFSFASDQLPPKKHYVVKQELYKYSYPLKDNTIPAWSVLLYALLGSLAVLYSLIFWDGAWMARELAQKNPSAPRKSIWELKRTEIFKTLHALLFSIFMTFAITNIIKNLVGRMRPDFVPRCWPNGVIVFQDNVMYPAEFNMDGGYPNCTGDAAVAKEGMRSFPSGHSSISMAGLGMVGWELFKALGTLGTHVYVWRPALGFLPFLLAILVAISRVNDYWHHWQDVTIGCIIGFVVSYISFRMWFPHTDISHLLLDELQQSRASSAKLRTSGTMSDPYPEHAAAAVVTAPSLQSPASRRIQDAV